MYISSAQIENYKSFRKSPTLQLTPGLNLITGANNVGKTALLECLSLRFSSTPNRSIETITLPPNETLSIAVSFVLNKADLWDIFKSRYPSETYWLEAPRASSSVAQRLGIKEFTEPEVLRFVEWFFKQEVYQFDLRLRVHPGDRDTTWSPVTEEASSVFSLPGSGYFSSMKINPYDGTYEATGRTTDADQADVGVYLASEFAKRVYSFKAERFALGSYERGLREALLPDARNLANVLDHLQDNPSQIREYTEAVRQVLPQIKQIAVRPDKDPKIRKIVIWTDDAAVKRNDLGFSLEECGTGVGQVLAILYIAHNVDTPMTIIIDEPQSFLHPGAARKLIEILQNYSAHQYIIATHSPTIISAAGARSITMVTQENSESSLQILDVTKVEHQSLYLNSIGARLADVFGYDRILWVEGKTEEKCFPVILERMTQQRVGGTAIVGIVNTGDLKGRDKNRALEIYHRLTFTTALIPPAIAFMFDSEGLTLTEMDDLKRASNGKIHFLKRRMYENYLLDANAITAVLSGMEDIDHPSVDEVAAWLSAEISKKEHFRTTRGPAKSDTNDWQTQINGAEILRQLFLRVNAPYDKVVHGLRLTESLIEQDRGTLRELADFLNGILSSSVMSTQSER